MKILRVEVYVFLGLLVFFFCPRISRGCFVFASLFQFSRRIKNSIFKRDKKNVIQVCPENKRENFFAEMLKSEMMNDDEL